MLRIFQMASILIASLGLGTSLRFHLKQQLVTVRSLPMRPASGHSIEYVRNLQSTRASNSGATILDRKRSRLFCTATAGESDKQLNPRTDSSVGRRTGYSPLLVSIEGNIGAGKSTLLNALRIRHREWTFIDEPVKFWTSLRNTATNESLLEVFYKDRRRWSYTFQNCALLTRYQMIEKAVEDALSQGKCAAGPHVLITERCLDTDYHVFTKMLYAEGSIDTMEFQLYEMWLAELRKRATPLSAIIHVYNSPEVCKQRIIQRGRIGEEGISMDYLHALDRFQQDWINNTDIPRIRASTDDLLLAEEFIANIIAKNS